MEKKFSIMTANGPQEITVGLADYQAAADKGINLSVHLQQKFGQHVNVDVHGTVFGQLCAQAGLFTRRDVNTGLVPPTLAMALGGIQAGAVVSPSSGSGTASGRLLLPELIMQVMNANLVEDKTDFIAGFERMVAIHASVNTSYFIQPYIDLSRPGAARSNAIGQQAMPAPMPTLSVSEAPMSIPTKSIGLVVTDQALEAATLDLVSLIMNEQVREERAARIEDMLTQLINGDVDAGIAALPAAVNMSDLDAAAGSGAVTQLGWLSFLRRNYRRTTIDWIMCDLATALKIETRSGRPGLTKDMKLDVGFTVSNLNITEPKIFLVDTDVAGADTIVGIDSRKAIRKVTNVNATYKAVENFVLSRETAFRTDFGETCHRLYDAAWDRCVID